MEFSKKCIILFVVLTLAMAKEGDQQVHKCDTASIKSAGSPQSGAKDAGPTENQRPLAKKYPIAAQYMGTEKLMEGDEIDGIEELRKGWLKSCQKTACNCGYLKNDERRHGLLEFQMYPSIGLFEAINDGFKESDAAIKIAGMLIYDVKEVSSNDNAQEKSYRIDYLFVNPKVDAKSIKVDAKVATKVQKGPSLPKGRVDDGESFLEAALRETHAQTTLTEDDFDVYPYMMEEVIFETEKSKNQGKEMVSGLREREAKKSRMGVNEAKITDQHYVKQYKRMQFYPAELKKYHHSTNDHTKAGKNKRESDAYIWVDLKTAKELCKYDELKQMMDDFEKIIHDKITYGRGYSKYLTSATGDIIMIRRDVMQEDLQSQEDKNKNWMKGCCGRDKPEDLDDLRPDEMAEEEKEGVLSMNKKSILPMSVDLSLRGKVILFNLFIQSYNDEESTPVPSQLFTDAQKNFKALMDNIKSTDTNVEGKKKYIVRACFDTYRNMVRVNAIETKKKATKKSGK